MSRVRPSTSALLFAAIATIVGFVACSEPITGLRRVNGLGSLNEYDLSDGYLWTDPTLWYRSVWVCAAGANGTFRVKVDTNAATTVTVDDDRCKRVHLNEQPSHTTELVTVTWLDSVSGPLDSIVPDSTHSLTRVRLATQAGSATRVVTTMHSKGGILTFHGALASVPASAPDSIPYQFYALEDTISGGSEMNGVMFPNIALVRFGSGTSQGQKQAALGAIAGTVVGGYPIAGLEGIYIVHVPTGSDAGSLFAAMEILRANPHVSFVGPELIYPGITNYRITTDGHASNSGAWQFNPGNAFGSSSRRRWALEAINAPFAWGCSTGGGVRVGVVDMDLHVEGEIASKVVSGLNLRPERTDNHGTDMASIIGSEANDGSGTTGVMWDSQLALAEVALVQGGTIVLNNNNRRIAFIGAVHQSLLKLTKDGARVINISLGLDTAYTSIPAHTAAQDQARERWAEVFRNVGTTTDSAHRPLIVMSAGNLRNAGHLYWNTLSGAKDGYDDIIFVSGASPTVGQLTSVATGHGDSLLTAPGELVAAFNANGSATATGSSPATALVSGVAGLVFGFDPTLTAAEVRRLLFRGAHAGGRTAGGHPFVDAYESLRLAASMNGRPLCGNRVWADASNQFFAQRDAATAEQLFSAGAVAFNATYANVHHGGRRIELAHGLRYILNGTTWDSVPWSPSDTMQWGGAFRGSSWFRNHENTFETSVAGVRSPGSVSFTVSASGRNGSTQNTSFVATTGAPQLTNVPTCVREEYGTCTLFEDVGTVDRPFLWSSNGSGTYTAGHVVHAVDPQGRFLIAALSIRRHEVVATGAWIECFNFENLFPDIRCRTATANVGTSWRSELYHIDLSTHAATRLSIASPILAEGPGGDEVNSLSINEQGTEIAVQAGGFSPTSPTFTCANGRHLWLRLGATPSATVTVAHSVSVPGPAICNGELEASGSSAAIRIVP